MELEAGAIDGEESVPSGGCRRWGRIEGFGDASLPTVSVCDVDAVPAQFGISRQIDRGVRCSAVP